MTKYQNFDRPQNQDNSITDRLRIKANHNESVVSNCSTTSVKESQSSSTSNQRQRDHISNSIDEITERDLEQDLSDPPSQYVPVIDYEDIKEELEAKDRYERNMKSHFGIQQKMEDEEHKLLQENDLNYYDKISITLK